MGRASLALVFAVACAPRTDFAPLRPGVCAEMECEDGHAWVEVTRDFAPRELTFVIDSLVLPRLEDGPGLVGVDVDGIDSGEGSTEPEAPCMEWHSDAVSSVEPGLRGVDNALADLVSSIESTLDASDCPGGTVERCVDGLLAQQVARAERTWVLTVGDVESFDHDAHVEVVLYEARIRAAPAAVGADGRLAAGQTFAGDRAGSAAGTILGGRLVARGLRIPLAFGLPIHGEPLDISLDLRQAQVRADITQAGLHRGILGGACEVPLVPRCTGLCIPEDAECRLEEIVADVWLPSGPRNACCGDCCNALSVGLGFTAIEAVLAR